jgi:integrase
MRTLAQCMAVVIERIDTPICRATACWRTGSAMWRAVQFNLKPSLADNARATTHPIRYTDNAAAFRRSELVALNRCDAEFTREGLIIIIRRSKTDQEAEGRKIGIPYGSNLDTCPIRSLQDWLERSGIDGGPIFRPINRHGRMALTRLSAAAVAEVVKKYVEAVGLNPDVFAGHSLRSGLATAAAAAGASERSIMNQTRHRSLTTVRKYIRTESLFRENAAAVLGL